MDVVQIEENHDETDLTSFIQISQDVQKSSNIISIDNDDDNVNDDEDDDNDNQSNEIISDNCTNSTNSHHENCTTPTTTLTPTLAITTTAKISVKNIEHQDDYINLSSAKSELESEVTNLSSTLDSRDDDTTAYDKDNESSSLDLSYKNKSLPDSVDNSLDNNNSESVPEFQCKKANDDNNKIVSVNLENSLSEKNSYEEKKEEEKNILFHPKINGSNSKILLKNNESEDENQDDNSSSNEVKICNELNEKDNFMLNENSCSSSSSSVGLVIDQQSEFTNTNSKNISQVIERDKELDEGENVINIQNVMPKEIIVKEKSIENFSENINNENDASETSKNTLCSLGNYTEISKNYEEKIVKDNNLKRKLSFCKDDEKSRDNGNNTEEIHSPEHKILHLDESYLTTLNPINHEKKLMTLNEDAISLVFENNETNKLKEIELNKKIVSQETDKSVSQKSSNITSSPILRNQLALKATDNDPGGILDNSSKTNDISNRIMERDQFETPSSTTSSEEQLQNDNNRNFRFNVQLSNFGNNYKYEKKYDKLIALKSPENLSIINDEKFTTIKPYKISKIEENNQNLNEVKDFSIKPSTVDYSYNSPHSNLSDLSTRNIQNIDKSENNCRNFNNDLEKTSKNIYLNNFNKKTNVSKDTLIDLTDDNIEMLSAKASTTLLQYQTAAITQKEKILQDWNKINSVPQQSTTMNLSQISQDSSKQIIQLSSSSDMKKFDNTSFNNQIIESSNILNKLDNPTNYHHNSSSKKSSTNNPSWKFAFKHRKQNQSADVTTNKSLKRSSKNLYQNNKHSRHQNNSTTKKMKEHSITVPSASYHPTTSIMNSSTTFNLSNKLNSSSVIHPPPPVYDLSQNLNRHNTELKCSKCFNSNFKNIRELENHTKFCLYPTTNSNESIFFNTSHHPQQHQQQQLQQLGISPINNNNRLSHFPTGINNLIPNVEDVILNIPKETNLPNFRNLLNKAQQPSSLFNINDAPIEITPNLNHYLNQVEQKHKNILQPHHHLNHNQNLFSHFSDETIKRSFLQNDNNRQQNIITTNEHKLNSDNLSCRYGGLLLNSGFQNNKMNKKKLQHLHQQQQYSASFLDNENILDYPIIHDSSNIFELNETPLNFTSAGFNKSGNGNVGLIKGLRRFSYSNSTRYGSNIDLSSTALSALNQQHPKQQIDNTLFSTSLQQQHQQKADSLEPIMLKIKQNQFSPILPPEQIQNKVATSTSLPPSLASISSASSSFQEPQNLIATPTGISENQLSTETQKPINLESQDVDDKIQMKNIEKEHKNKATNQNATNLVEQNQPLEENSSKLNIDNEIRKTKNFKFVESNNIEKKTKKLFLCSSCGSYHENWNLFLHMREMHKRHICLVCLRMFPTAEQLTVHLEMKHDIEQNHFESQEKLIRSSRDSCYLMCCTCEHIFTEHDDFFQHVCANYLKPCPLCSLLGKHAQTCKYGTSEHKKNKRNKKVINSKLQEQQLNSLNNNSTEKIINNKIKVNLSSTNNINETLGLLQNETTNDNLTIAYNQELQQQQLAAQYNDCDIIANNNQNNYLKDNQNNKCATDDLPSTVAGTNDEHINSDSQNESDSDSNNKSNGYLEHFNYNDNDLINLYKSNRLANIAKQKEKEEAEAKAKSYLGSNENEFNNDDELQNLNDKLEERLNSNSDNSCERISSMPKLTLKISKQMLNQAQNLTEYDSDEQSSTESSGTEENDDDENDNDVSKSDKEENDSSIGVVKENQKQNDSINNTTEKEAQITAKVLEPELKDLQDHENVIYPTLINIKLEPISNADEEKLDSNEDHVKEQEKNVDNSNEELMDDSKSDSDMDIDVTCNQGGDVAPITNIGLQPIEKKVFATPNTVSPSYQELENSTDAMQIDDEKSELTSEKDSLNNVENIPKLNEQIENSKGEQIIQDQELDTKLNEKTDTMNVVDQGSEQINNSIELQQEEEEETSLIPIKKIPTDGIELADEDVQILELSLDSPLDKISMVTLLRIMLKKTFPICLYCNHARRIAVNGNSLALHMLSSHRFSATVDSITAEELLPGTIITKLKSYLDELNEYYFNMETYCNIDRDSNGVIGPATIDEKIFECFSCRFATSIHKELYLHNRKMHLRTAILCFMCRSNFYSYSEILCHICPGAQHKVVLFDIKFRCCICELDQISSAFRLMVHFRKAHFACDVCLENCFDQSRLSSHVWKHKLHHLCYRCGIAYRNKPDITKHLFWKHGTESVLCKRCLQKRWPHVYHFCVPPSSFVCEICNLAFTRAMYLKVHKRLHSGDAPYPCTEESCDNKFISRKLLLKHVEEHEKIQSEEKSVTVIETNKTIKEEIDDDMEKSNKECKIKEEKLLSECKTDDKKETDKTDVHMSKKRKRKSKRSSEAKETLEDLNLQAPNLSESGSSDESDVELQLPLKQNSLVPDVVLSPPSEQDDEDDVNNKMENNPDKIKDIWNNFKTFQSNQDSGNEDSNLEFLTPILHVVQSDHDYCKMFKTSKEKENTTENDSEKKSATNEENKLNISKNSDKPNRSLLLPISPSKKSKQKSTKKHAKSGSESSSSDGSSSSSDSSCTCGSNCSCSSTTDSSSDSSSSSDTDSSSSESKKRNAAKRAAKEERRRNRLQSENSSKANNSDIVDVVTTDTKAEQTKLIEPVIYEDDLETDESDTDEDFYDEHPQKLASEILAEKRRQLMKQTCLSPSHNFDIVENSRPSTPSLPEDVYGSINSREKKVKVKKKKRERKASNKNLIPPFKLNINKTNIESDNAEPQFVPPITPKPNLNGSAIMVHHTDSFIPSGAVDILPVVNASIVANKISEMSAIYQKSVLTNSTTSTTYQGTNSNIMPTGFALSTSAQPMELIPQKFQQIMAPSAILNPSIMRSVGHTSAGLYPTLGPAPIDPNFIRHSTESSSDASAHLLSNADNTLKRSKRARRPNRFYGYSSDDEASHNASLLGASSIFKPIPPPNLTWRKEDLPTPPRNSSGKNIKSPGLKISTNKKLKLSKKKENSNKKEKQFGSKLINMGNSSDVTQPRIPTIKIKPLDIIPQVPPSILDHQPIDTSNYQQIPQPPPVVEPINSVPSVPVHHIDPPQFYASSKESIDSDSESDEDKLTIPLQIFNMENKPVQQSSTKATKKSSMPKVPKNNATKNNKGNKMKNTSGVRTSYNAVPQQKLSALSNIQMEIKEPTPPPKEKRIPPALLPNPDLLTLQYFKRNNIRYPIRPPAGARPPREGESVYCYCRCPYDEVSEMIACDGDDCMIEWFHFECVGILVAPQGKWFCAECKPNQPILYAPVQVPTQPPQQQFHYQQQQLQHQYQITDTISNYGTSSSINNLGEFNGPSNNSNTNGGFNDSSSSVGC